MVRARRFARTVACLCAAFLAFGTGLVRAQQATFGDVAVTAAVLHHGRTWHGYLELRVWLENRSERHTREVRLSFPATFWGGNLGQISRTVVIPPGGRMEVSLWQPPLDKSGDNRLLVEVDGHRGETLDLPDVGSHSPAWTRWASPSAEAPTFLIGQGVDAGVAEAMFSKKYVAGGAMMATGGPDARGVRPAEAWMPDEKAPGPHWLELHFHPVRAERLRVYDAWAISGSRGEPRVTVVGTSGRTLADVTVPPSTGRRSPTGPSVAREVALGQLDEPIKTVRLEFISTPAHEIAVDTVELVGPDGRAWPVHARASSETSMMVTRPSVSVQRSGLRAGLGVGAWSRHWLSYTPYDAVVLGPGDVRAMPAAVADALWRYAECGGQLIAFGDLTVPDPWARWCRTNQLGARVYSVGWGRCVVLPESVLKQGDPDLEVWLHELADGSVRFWRSLPRGGVAHASLPLLNEGGLSLRWFLLLGIGCFLVVGPLQWWVLWRFRRHYWMLWTLPASSLLATVGVLLFPILREGFATRVRMDSVTVLDQVGHRAATLAGLGYYSVLAPGQGLLFDEQTELTPLVVVEPRVARSGVRLLDWTRGQHLVEGWVQPRVPAMFMVRKSENRRERLQWEQTDEGLTVVNGLGARVTRLWLADHEGRVWEGTDIAPGARVTLEPTGRLAVRDETPLALEDFWKRAAYGRFAPWAIKRGERLLRAGTYLAELEGNPFLETGLAPGTRVRRMPGSCVVYGILEKQGGTRTAGP